MLNNDDFYYASEIHEDNSSTQSAYSCCIAFLCMLCGYVLLQTNYYIEGKSNPYYYQCTMTLPLTYFCGVAFLIAAAVRFVFLIVFCLQSEKQQPHSSLFHKKVKHSEIMIAMAFFFFGSFILMVKEQCYELTVALLFVLILTAFMILQICCYDIDDDEVICEEILDY
ncbi:unnamed protein product [Paramecium primaurelia]|uniref:Uncharacterized protein n=1 Tax=Paramecium primaurelia TaxID=5886 RepID=A0A8S1MGU4_PARPR|nr:unnamed protein product [Paramecium primaurelia]